MKKILITGAESGIGRDTVIALVKLGHSVIATTKTEESVIELAQFAQKQPFECKFEILKLDITSESDREKIRSLSLDVLINDAGAADTGPLSEIPLDRLRAVFEVNVFGTLALSQIALAGMIERKKGSVIIVSSVAGRLPIPFLAPYGMTKFALSAGAAAMRDEVHIIAPDVHVSLIEPGAYATGFNEEMGEKKYAWMKEDSKFHSILSTLRSRDSLFYKLQVKRTTSIVRKIVQAAESDAPKLRYVAPWYQGVGVQLARMLGK
jgi:short-subunit dehydrogenase